MYTFFGLPKELEPLRNRSGVSLVFGAARYLVVFGIVGGHRLYRVGFFVRIAAVATNF